MFVQRHAVHQHASWPRCVLMRRNARLQGFKRDELNTERFLNLRYDGTDVPVMTQCAEGDDYAKVGISPDHACNLCL